MAANALLNGWKCIAVKSNKIYGTYMPEETFEALREFVVSIKAL